VEKSGFEFDDFKISFGISIIVSMLKLKYSFKAEEAVGEPLKGHD